MASQISSKTQEDFYKDAANYWSEIPPTIDGMLGGFGHISEIDIKTSKTLLRQLFSSKEPPGRNHALDCGAGIGRITKFLLCDLFDKVDMVEQNPRFLDRAKSYLGPRIMEQKIGKMYPEGLQSFEPELNKYDVIWAQWVLGHLTDDDFVHFFKSCQNGLKPNGVIIAKENITSSETVEVDEKDSSVTRPLSMFKELFHRANLECYGTVKQHNFPKGIYTVYMFVLKPQLSEENISNNNEENSKSLFENKN